VLLLFPVLLAADVNKIIDPGASTLTVHVGKAGIFSAAGHEHWIDAPIARGEFTDGAAPHVEFSVDARRMTVKPDAKVSTKDQAQIQETMQRTVLDSERFPEIAFRSTSVTPTGEQSWRVTGMLTLHGVSKPVVVEVHRNGGAYAGTARIKQAEFGIQPVAVAGGTVKTKNELDIRFEIRASK
jgi:polyisoprenoid-binding protein YceI